MGELKTTVPPIITELRETPTVSTATAARALGVGPHAVNARIDAGSLKAIVNGRRRRVVSRAVLAELGYPEG